VDESGKKRPLADDPGFISSLSDLDRGLIDAGRNDLPEAGTNTPAAAPRRIRRIVRRRRRLPVDGAAPARAPSLPAAPAAPPTAAASPPVTLPAPVRDTRVGPPNPALAVAPAPALLRRRRGQPDSSTPTAAIARPVPDDRVPSLPYETFYGLTEKPFSLSTDPVFLYHSTAHDRTAQALLTSIGTRPGVVVITGPYGIGKTSLCRAVIEQLDRRTLTSFLVDPFLTVDDLLQTLLIDFGALSRDDLAGGRQPSTDQLRDTLHSFLASLASLQAGAVVLVDEAQNLPVAVLDELRARSEIREGRRLLHVVLLGEPALASMLKQEALRPLNAQVAVRSALGPLLPDEVRGYVMHRLGVVGNGARVAFSEAALARIHELTGGVPRVVNLLCDRAMSRGYEASAGVIDVSHVNVAAVDLDLSVPVVETPQTLRLAVGALAFVVLMLVGAGAALWVFRDDVRRAVVQWEGVPPTPSPPRIPQSVPLRVPSVPVSVLPRTRPADDNRPASSVI
jgi:general secretion pathway protein A